MAAAQIRPICCGSRLQPRLPSLLQISLISSLMDCPVHGFVSGGLRGGGLHATFFFSPSPAPLQGCSQLWMLLLVFQTLSPHLRPSVSTHVSLKPRLRWVEPQHATALFPCADSLGFQPKTVLPPCGFHTWEERNNLYMG